MVKILEGGTPRRGLGEGRNYGFGSAFCKRTGKEEYTLLFGITACKDFLGDVLLAEECGVKVDIYGLKYSKCEPFQDRFAYIAISMLDTRDSGWYRFTKEKERLASNWKNIPLFLHYFEEYFNIPQRTKILPTEEEGVYLLKVPKTWATTTYLISLYTLLIRIGYNYDGKQKAEDYVKALLTPPNGFKDELGEDVGRLMDVWPKIEWMKENGFPKENFKTRLYFLGQETGWHNNGIGNVKIGKLKDKWLE